MGLQAARFLPQNFVLDGAEYWSWRENLKDLNDKFLQAGLKHSSTFHGFMTWAEFRKLCVDGVAIRTEQGRRSQPPKTAILSDLSSIGKGKQWDELMKVHRAMREEGPDGPITKASREGRLTNNVVRGRSAEQIIKFCKELFL